LVEELTLITLVSGT